MCQNKLGTSTKKKSLLVVLVVSVSVGSNFIGFGVSSAGSLWVALVVHGFMWVPIKLIT